MVAAPPRHRRSGRGVRLVAALVVAAAVTLAVGGAGLGVGGAFGTPGATTCGAKVYYADSRGVVVLDPTDDTELGVVPDSESYGQVLSSPDGTRIYNFWARSVFTGIQEIDAVTDTVLREVALPARSASSGFMAMTPDGSKLYIANDNADLYVVPVSTFVVSTVTVESSAPTTPVISSIAVSPDGSKLYLGDNQAATPIIELSTATDSVSGEIAASVISDRAISALWLSPNGGTLYAVNRDFKKLFVIATATDALIATVDLPETPGDPTYGAVSPDGAWLYVNSSDATLMRIDLGSGTVAASIAVSGAEFVAFDPTGSTAYVTNYEDPSQVVVVDVATGTITTTITGTGDYPWGITYCAAPAPPPPPGPEPAPEPRFTG